MPLTDNQGLNKESSPTSGSRESASWPRVEVSPEFGAESHQEPIYHLNQVELSRRWRISPRTLERWRWLNQPPNYLKIGGRVVYRLEDVKAYEAAQRR